MRKIAQINVYGSHFECVSPLDLAYFLWEKSYLVKVCPFSHRSAYQMSYWFQNIYEETFEFEFLNNSLSIFHPIKDYQGNNVSINLIGLDYSVIGWIDKSCTITILFDFNSGSFATDYKGPMKV